ncbi:MAG: OmpA family protein, partial [Deltaproteobacteria bacterium]|nr:OmpA family protein [Deltaproteobacteria bacterium]
YNYTLSKGRAEAVARLLVTRGVQQDHINTTSHGEGNLLIKTGDNVNEPKNRRVEVVVR